MTIARGACFVCLQETHGTIEVANMHLVRVKRDFLVYPSSMTNAVGGTLTLVSKTRVPSRDCIAHGQNVRGRITRTQVLGNIGAQAIWNVHNYDILRGDWQPVVARLTDDLARAAANPLNSTVFVVGDINDPADSNLKFPYGAPIRPPWKAPRCRP